MLWRLSWPWLGPPLTTMQYAMCAPTAYFWLYVAGVVFLHNGPNTDRPISFRLGVCDSGLFTMTHQVAQMAKSAILYCLVYDVIVVVVIISNKQHSILNHHVD